MASFIDLKKCFSALLWRVSTNSGERRVRRVSGDIRVNDVFGLRRLMSMKVASPRFGGLEF